MIEYNEEKTKTYSRYEESIVVVQDYLRNKFNNGNNLLVGINENNWYNEPNTYKLVSVDELIYGLPDYSMVTIKTDTDNKTILLITTSTSKEKYVIDYVNWESMSVEELTHTALINNIDIIINFGSNLKIMLMNILKENEATIQTVKINNKGNKNEKR